MPAMITGFWGSSVWNSIPELRCQLFLVGRNHNVPQFFEVTEKPPLPCLPFKNCEFERYLLDVDWWREWGLTVWGLMLPSGMWWDKHTVHDSCSTSWVSVKEKHWQKKARDSMYHLYNNYNYMRFPNIGLYTPQIIHCSQDFPFINLPASGVPPF